MVGKGNKANRAGRAFEIFGAMGDTIARAQNRELGVNWFGGGHVRSEMFSHQLLLLHRQYPKIAILLTN